MLHISAVTQQPLFLPSFFFRVRPSATLSSRTAPTRATTTPRTRTTSARTSSTTATSTGTSTTTTTRRSRSSGERPKECKANIALTMKLKLTKFQIRTYGMSELYSIALLAMPMSLFQLTLNVSTTPPSALVFLLLNDQRCSRVQKTVVGAHASQISINCFLTLLLLTSSAAARTPATPSAGASASTSSFASRRSTTSTTRSSSRSTPSGRSTGHLTTTSAPTG